MWLLDAVVVVSVGNWEALNKVGTGEHGDTQPEPKLQV